jgi:hypothetical protein
MHVLRSHHPKEAVANLPNAWWQMYAMEVRILA